MTDTQSPDIRTPASRTDSPCPPLDALALLERCMGNAALVAMLFDKFEKQAREDLVRIEQAIASHDAGQASRVAHALKGAAGALSATEVQKTAAAIEHAARENRLDAAAECCTTLTRELDRCLAYLPSARAAVNPQP